MAMIHSSLCPLTRTCLQARTRAGLSFQWRSHALSLRQAKIGIGRGCSSVHRTCSCQTILHKRGRMPSVFCSMNSVPRMHGADKLSATSNRSNRRTPSVSTYRCMAYCCPSNFGRCGRSQDRLLVNCPLVQRLYPAEWMAEKLFRTVDHPS